MATSQDLLESALDVSNLHGDLQAFPYLYAAFQTEPWNTQHAVNCAVAIYRGIISHKFLLHKSEDRVLAVKFAIDCFAWAEMRDPLDDLITDNTDVRRALENMLEQEEAWKHMKSKEILPKPRLVAAYSIPRAKPLRTWLGDIGIPFNSDCWNLYSEGRLLFEAGWFDEAAVYFSAAAVAASDDPASSLFYAELGLSQLQVGKCAAANASFSSAIDRSSHFYKEIFISANVTSSFMFNISASLLRLRLQTCENKMKILSSNDQEKSQDEDWNDVSQAQMIAESSISMEFDDMGNQQQTNSHYSMTVAEYLSEKGRVFDLSNRIETNSTLREALRKYEHMHGSMIEKFRRTGSSSAKFLVVQLSRALGIGNRLLILVGAFLLSLLTERALLVHWPSHPAPLENLFALPPGTAGILLPAILMFLVFIFPFVRPCLAVEWSYNDFMAMLTPTNLQKVNISKYSSLWLMLLFTISRLFTLRFTACLPF